MSFPEINIPIVLLDGSKIELTIFSESNEANSLILISEAEAAEFGEAQIQLLEGYSYEYKISSSYYLGEIPKVVSQFKSNKFAGRITPSIFVGTLNLDVYYIGDSNKVGTYSLEVRSTKTTYRQDYRFMLEDITNKCTELLLQYNSPVYQRLSVDFTNDSKSLYQRFAFIKSLLDSAEFLEAAHRIITHPYTSWIEKGEENDNRNIKKISNSVNKQLASTGNRIPVSNGHSLQSILSTVPSKVVIQTKKETLDNSENRFIKYFFKSFYQFCSDVRSKFSKSSRAFKEALQLEEVFDNLLNQSIFKEVSEPQTLKLNSPVLQRKEGYREVLRTWLMFDLAAKITWKGGENIYEAGKRDVAILYEYWVFFTLLDVLKDIFKIEPAAISQLIQPTADGLNLKLKSGEHIPFKGIYNSGVRNLQIEFSFNKTFSGSKEYPI